MAEIAGRTHEIMEMETMTFPLFPSLRAALVVGTVLTAAACAGMRVDTDYDPQASFSDLRAYEWLDSTEITDELAAISPFLERRIRRAVDRALEERGFVNDPGGEVDFRITSFVVAPEGSEIARCRGRGFACGAPVVSLQLGFGYPYGYGLRYPWYWFRHPYRMYPWGYAHAYRIGFGYTWLPLYERPSGRLPGTLVLDVFDAANGELIWRGWAEGALIDLPRTEETQQYLDETVAKILERFPPPS